MLTRRTMMKAAAMMGMLSPAWYPTGGYAEPGDGYSMSLLGSQGAVGIDDDWREYQDRMAEMDKATVAIMPWRRGKRVLPAPMFAGPGDALPDKLIHVYTREIPVGYAEHPGYQADDDGLLVLPCLHVRSDERDWSTYLAASLRKMLVEPCDFHVMMYRAGPESWVLRNVRRLPNGLWEPELVDEHYEAKHRMEWLFAWRGGPITRLRQRPNGRGMGVVGC